MLASGAPSIFPGDKCSRLVCGGRRPLRIGQTRRICGWGGGNGGDVRSSVSGGISCLSGRDPRPERGAKMSVNIEVTFDFVCPWCYIGVKRLMRAIEGLSDDFDWNLSWKPYEINPKLPAAGVDRSSYRATKYGEARGRMVDAQVEAQARYDSVQIDMNSIGIMANSRLAHRLRLLAKEKNLERRYIHAVYKAYFEAGINIGI